VRRSIRPAYRFSLTTTQLLGLPTPPPFRPLSSCHHGVAPASPALQSHIQQVQARCRRQETLADHRPPGLCAASRHVDLPVDLLLDRGCHLVCHPHLGGRHHRHHCRHHPRDCHCYRDRHPGDHLDHRGSFRARCLDHGFIFDSLSLVHSLLADLGPPVAALQLAGLSRPLALILFTSTLLSSLRLKNTLLRSLRSWFFHFGCLVVHSILSSPWTAIP